MNDERDHGAFDRTMQLLAEGIPLSLLIDLASPMHSREIYQEEPGDTDWLVTAGVA